MSESLTHYGTPRHSGRYPWGSGENPYQRSSSFMSYVNDLKEKGLTDVEIAKSLGMTTTQLRERRSIAKDEIRAADAAQALRLKDKGYSTTEIGRIMNKNESSIRSLLDPVLRERANVTKATADMLKSAVSKKRYIDVGSGVENYIGVAKTKLNTALSLLKEEGYNIYYIKVEQVGNPGKYTSVKVLAPPDATYSEVAKNKDKIELPNAYTENKGKSYVGLEPIRSVDSSRILVRYKEDGGGDKDGVIELRRGVDDISLGSATYAQVRIGVDDTHFLKGMAIHTDDIPKGYDIVFNTNKSSTGNDLDAMKKLEADNDNPFGAIVRQKHYIDSEGKEQLSALNIVGYTETAGEEGAWGEWSRTLSSQVLSKQNPSLAKKQLGIAYDQKKEEFDEIMSLTNPLVKKKLLETFADGCDAASADLKAAALPRQSSHVILPLTDIKENEVYAPNYRDGEQVVLIRHPHGGTFEIPQLTVNNRHPSGKKILGQARDAVGIHPKVAERLSGADFDGDTVLVIPNPPSVGIKTSPPLKDLVDFDPREMYKGYEGMKRMTKAGTGMHMGNVSNLITDMTIKGASSSEIARAVRHSMVVIDAEKHNLNYEQSYIDNGIAALKKKYQGGENRGASTLISRASADIRVPMRKLKPVNRMTPKELKEYREGKKIYEYTGETYTNKYGKEVVRTTVSKKMLEVDDAHKLSSGTKMETIYANYANQLKSLANRSRKEALMIKPRPYSPSAKKVYENEVKSLNAKLNLAILNRPLERKAQLIADAAVRAKKAANPDMDRDRLKKIKQQELRNARYRVGADRYQIKITDKEWEAIQHGAISTNVLTQILNNTDLDRIKELATPRTSKTMTTAKIARAKSMLANGYTQAEVADALGVSTTTINNLV